MASIPPSDTESNVSGFIQYSNKHFKHLYISMIESMETINHDILEIEKNLTNIVKQSGPLESQLSVLLHSLPKENLNVSMEIE
ncbi:uncharacterized protein LOC128202173 [Galleria mellonella]|uniref:Uncharacterized protein LOC128202173 n=1 Tax=Galleria mellonella TaxID=7137 RepID=A0ABM3N1D6_GALME|nr:uncharacterized protein LOC128202173 [Galleria mellonella]